MFRYRHICVSHLLALALALSACGHHATAPIVQKSPSAKSTRKAPSKAPTRSLPAPRQNQTTYTVRKGDTLHAIAWRFGKDYRDLVKWNRIRNPDVIFVGQKLKLAVPQSIKRNVGKSAVANSRKSVAPTKTPAKRRVVAARSLRWSWPATGSVRPAKSALGSKGIEILGKRGEPVRATEAGKVVYSGSGLRGYGRLIIVKHSEEFLSAYAHNERLLVAEGATVNRGERIAEMGDSEAKRIMLHFEIRKNGKAVQPLKLLPQR